MTLRELNSATQIFDVLGGIQAMAELTGARYSAAFNWKASGSFPAKTYVAISMALRARGYTAPDSLWGMVESSSEPVRCS